MGKLTNIRSNDARLPIFRFVLSRNGIDGSVYSNSKREIQVPDMSSSALQNMWAGIDQSVETNYNNLSRYNLLNIRFSNDLTNVNDAKRIGKVMVTQGADIARKTVISMAGYSENEALGWADKAAIARRVLDDSATADEINQLETEAAARGLGETVEQLATKQIDNATAFRLKRSIIDGNARRVKNQIDAATTINSLRDIIHNFVDNLAADLVSAE